MRRTDADFLQRIRAAFQVEAREHLQAVAVGLVGLEQSGPDPDHAQLETVFRHTHSLKGAARAAGLGEVEAVCQALESVFVECRARRLALQPDDFDLLHRGFDLAGALIGGGDASAEAGARLARIVAQLEALAARSRSGAAPTRRQATERAGVADTVTPVGHDVPGGQAPLSGAGAGESVTRVSTPDLDQLLRSAEEMLSLKHAGQERARSIAEVEQVIAAWSKQWAAVQVPLRQLRRATKQAAVATPPQAKLVEFLDASFGTMKQLEAQVGALARSAARDRAATGRQVDELLQQSKHLVMRPCSVLTDLLPKVVRDLARSQGKRVQLVIEGGDVQVDKRLLDQMKDPVIHMLRNAIDHGIETPSQRQEAGKPEAGRIRFATRFLGGDKIEIAIEDDGRGIDAQAMRDAAIRCGAASSEGAAQLDDLGAIDLAFRADVSTSPRVTELSGRGLGLAIVREQVEGLGGQVTVETRPGRGTRLLVTLPQSLGALRGLFVRVADRTFVLPGMHVAAVSRVPLADLQTVRNRETVTRAGRVVFLVPLRELLGLSAARAPEPAEFLTVVFLDAGSDMVALAVDDVVDDDEVLVKKLEPPLLRVRHVAGATIDAAGAVIPVLSVPDLIKSARSPRRRPVGAMAPESRQQAVRGRVLLAEDSITSRLLLKGILESAGYEVATAADGVEAYTALRSGRFDVVVSDIEMPRLNGFDLTAKVRADPVLSQLPVVLVTALARREDRERGIDVGASAYITKGSFDQRDLLETVGRLLRLGERA